MRDNRSPSWRQRRVVDALGAGVRASTTPPGTGGLGWGEGDL
ncbi:hypothetical protein [Micromonospora inositola]|nr:hypothetical protein [Micromonospora inositola]